MKESINYLDSTCMPLLTLCDNILNIFLLILYKPHSCNVIESANLSLYQPNFWAMDHRTFQILWCAAWWAVTYTSRDKCVAKPPKTSFSPFILTPVLIFLFPSVLFSPSVITSILLLCHTYSFSINSVKHPRFILFFSTTPGPTPDRDSNSISLSPSLIQYIFTQ